MSVKSDAPQVRPKRLLVQYGTPSKRHQPFHPTLRLRDTGYARGHWQEMHFTTGLFVGAGSIRERNLQSAIAHYFSELRRMGYTEVAQ